MSKFIQINVGGVIHSTTEETLMKSRLLGPQLEGDDQTVLDNNGLLFINRDGELFKLVLKYLQTGRVDVKTQLVDSFINELDHYQVNRPRVKAPDTITFNIEEGVRGYASVTPISSPMSLKHSEDCWVACFDVDNSPDVESNQDGLVAAISILSNHGYEIKTLHKSSDSIIVSGSRGYVSY